MEQPHGGAESEPPAADQQTISATQGGTGGPAGEHHPPGLLPEEDQQRKDSQQLLALRNVAALRPSKAVLRSLRSLRAQTRVGPFTTVYGAQGLPGNRSDDPPERLHEEPPNQRPSTGVDAGVREPLQQG